MKAMILAAGRGERMGELTDDLPKPMLAVGGVPMIERMINQLAAAGIVELVINIAWQGQKLRDYLGDGSRLGVTINWSDEGPLPLGTAEGVRRALPLIGDELFLLVNGDLIGKIGFSDLVCQQPEFAHLVLVDNPGHHPVGDFCLVDGSLAMLGTIDQALTYMGCGVYRPSLFLQNELADLGPLLKLSIEQGLTINAQKLTGWWLDVGTPERLRLAEQLLLKPPEQS
ncbi:MAG: nucleotidyltransferase family protein [Immundisolibacteraceae bacterium]|nr:nucleotidyltransferase family protein [Immundisolibacteraceae bacterium]